MMIGSARQEVFLLQWTVTLEQLWGAEEGTIESIPRNEGRIAQAWVNVRGGFRISLLLAFGRMDVEK